VNVPHTLRRAAFAALARRLALALALAAPAAPARAADVPLPPPPAGTARLGAAPAADGTWVGLSVGPFAAFDRGQSFGAQLDYGFDRTPPSWQKLRLEWHLVLAAARPTADTLLTRTEVVGVYPPMYQQVPAGSEHATALVAEIVPTARVVYPVVPGFSFIADGGVGVVQTVEKYERDETFVGASKTTKNVTGLSIHAGLGVAVDLGARTRLVFQPVALAFLAGTDYSAFTPNIGLAFRL
jgi:hypothetical protein